jgi:hypothetical protein
VRGGGEGRKIEIAHDKSPKDSNSIYAPCFS